MGTSPATDEELTLIRSMKDQGYINSEIGRALGRGTYAINHICRQYRIRVNRKMYDQRRLDRLHQYANSHPPDKIRPLLSEEEIAKLYAGQRYEDVPEHALRLEEKRRSFWFMPRRSTGSATGSSTVTMMEAAV